MEYFSIRSACPIETLPIQAAGLERIRIPIRGVSLVGGVREGYLTFCDRIAEDDPVDRSCASIVLAPAELATRIASRFPGAQVVAVADARATFIDIVEHLQGQHLLDPSSSLPEVMAIASDAEIGDRVTLEPGVRIDSQVRVGSGAVIRSGTWLQSGASVGENSVVGTVGINAYVGKDGRKRTFPHLAAVVVGEGTTIGASCVVVRGLLTSTRIGAGTTLGNLCNVGHGVQVGDGVWISVGTMIGGHTRVGDGATVGLGCAIRDNVTIGPRARVGMGSVVTKDIAANASVFGNPAKVFRSIDAGPAR